MTRPLIRLPAGWSALMNKDVTAAPGMPGMTVISEQAASRYYTTHRDDVMVRKCSGSMIKVQSGKYRQVQV